MQLRHFYTFVCISVLAPTEVVHAQAIEMTMPDAGAGGAQVLPPNIRQDPSDWPYTFKFYSGVYMCTSTAIGSRVIITAAHCVEDGATATVKTSVGSTTVTCDHHPRYNRQVSEIAADIALCLATNDIPIVDLYERVNLSSAILKVGNPILLLGFGCTTIGVPSSGILYAGMAKIRSLSPSVDKHLMAGGGANEATVCPGDSGGSAYFGMATASNPSQSREIIGINSAYNKYALQSFIVQLSQVEIAQFVRDWAQDKRVKICGVHDDAKNCRGV